MTLDGTAFKGVFPPMVTPLRGHDALDVPGTEKLTDHILGGKVQGLFILGTTGEAPSLTHRLRHEFVERVGAHVAKRVPLLVGITDTSFVESINLAEKAADSGADAVVLAPPYYFPAGQVELLEYIEHLLPRLPLPLFLYNMPSMTKLVYEPDTVKTASEMPGVIGLKDSSGNMGYFHKLLGLLKGCENFSLLMGMEELMGEALLMGADGGVCGGANVAPGLFVELYEAAKQRDLERVMAKHAEVMQLGSLLYGVGQHTSSYLKGLKCALSCMGICDDFMAEPFHRFRNEHRTIIQSSLTSLGLL